MLLITPVLRHEHCALYLIKWKMNTSVIAVCDIPEGTCSLPGVGEINMRCLLEKATLKTYFHVDIRDGHLSVTEIHVGQSWARFIAVAKNCHEQNVELTKGQHGLILRTTRFVRVSEELLVWIGSDLLLELEFPFLKPANIKGNQAYHCHKCGQVFQNPNPLKVHLSFQCLNPQSLLPFEQPICSKLDTQFRIKALEITQSFENANNVERSTMNSTVPPFLPLLNEESSNSERYSHSRKCKTLPELKSSTAIGNSGNICYDLTFKYLSQNSASSLTASSSMWIGNSSRCPMSSPGHVCAYCGKVYSRKYGLKIHVRTHTGYKPLKCKYCFRSFSDPSNLNKHVRLHSEADTPYRCPICGKVLVRRRDLQRHIKSRHQQDKLVQFKKREVELDATETLKSSK